MKIFKSFNILNKEITFNETIGFVPTMGSLHNGHLSLIKIAKKKSKKVLVSIFVNPSQFNDKKDFLKYPRDFKKDISILKKIGVNYLFLPNKNEIYKKGIRKKINIYKKDNLILNYKKILIAISPIIPHFSNECLEMIKTKKVEWPKYDQTKIKEDTVNIVVQINGKKRGLMETQINISEKFFISSISFRFFSFKKKQYFNFNFYWWLYVLTTMFICKNIGH